MLQYVLWAAGLSQKKHMSDKYIKLYICIVHSVRLGSDCERIMYAIQHICLIQCTKQLQKEWQDIICRPQNFIPTISTQERIPIALAAVIGQITGLMSPHQEFFEGFTGCQNIVSFYNFRTLWVDMLVSSIANDAPSTTYNRIVLYDVYLHRLQK